MSKKKSKATLAPTFESLLRLKFRVFTELVNDLLKLYDEGKFRIFLLSNVASGDLSEIETEILRRKYDLSREELATCVFGFIVLAGRYVTEEEELEKRIEGQVTASALKDIKKKEKFVAQKLEKYPSIKQNFFAYSLSKGDFFSGIEWSTELKVSHSPTSLPLASPPITPVGKVRIDTFNISETPPAQDSFDFEITEADLNYMLNSLSALKKSLEVLKQRKLK